MKRIFVWVLFILMLCSSFAQMRFGLTVKDGMFYKDGKEAEAHGINYFNLFTRSVSRNGDTKQGEWKEGLKVLQKYKIPFVRFAASPYWPTDWNLYFKDKKAYYKAFDEVVAEAQRRNIGLIPSFFWHMSAIPDLMKEPMSAWGNSKSKTREFMRSYTKEIVSRYKNSPAIWGWEFGNEYMLHADIRKKIDEKWEVWPKLGTPEKRTDADLMTRKMIVDAYVEYATIVRSIDPYRAIFTGDAIQRASAWHNTYEGNWKKDTPEQYAQIMAEDYPDPINTVSIHYYFSGGKAFEGHPMGANHMELLKNINELAKKMKKPLFVGEWSAGNIPASDVEGRKKNHAAVSDAIKANGIKLSAFWVFDLGMQDDTHNVTEKNSQAYVLSLLKKMNDK